jgi:hypothetical protein
MVFEAAIDAQDRTFNKRDFVMAANSFDVEFGNAT